MNLEGTREMKQGGGTGTTRLTPSVLRVLIVDDELGTRKLLTAMLREAGVPCKAAACAEEGLIALETEPTDAVLSDLQMPGISGMAFLAEVRERYRHLAFVMMTGVEDIRVGIEAMKRGADDYLVKPLQIEIVMASLERALKKKRLEQEVENYRQRLEEMVKERTGQLETALWKVERGYEDTLKALGAAIDLRDSETSGHSQRVTLYSAEIVLTHHERCDGSGYPRGLKTTDIPAGARIFAIADTVDAMTSDRPYRSALSFEMAHDEIRRGSGSRYDSRVADAFLGIAIESWKEIRRSTDIPGSGFERMEGTYARSPNYGSRGD